MTLTSLSWGLHPPSWTQPLCLSLAHRFCSLELSLKEWWSPVKWQPRMESLTLGWLPGLTLAVTCQCGLAWWLWDLIVNLIWGVDFHLTVMIWIFLELFSVFSLPCSSGGGGMWDPFASSSPSERAVLFLLGIEGEHFPASADICLICKGFLSSTGLGAERWGKA